MRSPRTTAKLIITKCIAFSYNISAGHTSHLQVYICKPEGWYGQPKYSCDKTRSDQLHSSFWISRFWPQKGLSISYNFLDL